MRKTARRMGVILVTTVGLAGGAREGSAAGGPELAPDEGAALAAALVAPHVTGITIEEWLKARRARAAGAGAGEEEDPATGGAQEGGEPSTPADTGAALEEATALLEAGRREEAIDALTKLVEAGHVASVERLADGLLEGPASTEGTGDPSGASPEDLARAQDIYQIAADAGSGHASMQLGMMALGGAIGPVDAASAVQHFEQAAERGVTEAHHELGLCHLDGQGVEPDPAAALEHFTRAANAGYAPSQHSLGRALDEGLGGTPDRAAAARWYGAAAAAGHAEAAADLGYLHLGGDGVNADPAAARKYFAQAAEGGHPNGEFGLAVLQEKGIGEDSNVPAAVARYRTLAEQGHEAARERLKSLCE